MKIGIDARFYRKETAGIGRYTRALIWELAKIDQKNEYVVFITPEDEKEYDEEVRSKNFRKSVVSIKHYSLAEQTKFISVLNKEKLDIVHFLNFNHPIFYQSKFIVTIHDLTVLYFPVGRQQKDSFRRWAFKAVMNNAVKRSNKVIAVSKATKNDIIKSLNGNQEKIEVIYEGIDPNYRITYNTKPVTQERIDINNVTRYTLHVTKPYLLFLSQWRPHKGLPDLIKAFENLKSKHKIPHQLVIGGKPNPAFPEIPQAIRNSPYASEIITPGFIPEEDLPAIYAGADIFIFPSHYEGFGLPPLEAMACGTPVVAANVSCMPEILGNAAEYFVCKDIDNMAEKISNALKDKSRQKEMIELGFKQARKYSWAKMAEETLALYR